MPKPNLPKFDECCGCGVCVDICPKKALQLIENSDGFFMPQCDESICVACGLCEKNCHLLHQDKMKRNDRKTEELYSAWTLDTEIIKKSASGGVFTQLAKKFLARDNSFVYGATLNEDSSVSHIFISDIGELPKLQGAKYHQSYSVGIYKDVKSKLKSGCDVLFSGVSCQVAGLLYYLKYDEELLQHLWTAEILCHGVPSNYTKELALKLNGAKRVVAYRTKMEGWERGNRTVYEYEDGIRPCGYADSRDFMFKAFLTNAALRPSCTKCKYAVMDRIADLTFADFWYWEKDRKDFQNPEGTSLILANSSKGKDLLKSSGNVKKTPITFEQATIVNQNLYMPQNLFVVNLSKHIHTIKKLPTFMQKLILQQDFSNPVLCKIRRGVDRYIFSLRKLLLKKKTKEMNTIRSAELSKLRKK